MSIDKVVSGGQSGVDRAALDAALELGVPCGGWCPRGRWAEDGILSVRYPLRETPGAKVGQRTWWNVRDSDGTLVVTEGDPSGGTALTVHAARVLGKPCLVVDLADYAEADGDSMANGVVKIVTWLGEERIRVLNVAGPRESGRPGIYRRAYALLSALLVAVGPAFDPPFVSFVNGDKG